jgi:hypothetical protein
VAQIVFRARDNTSSPMAWRRGMPVEILPDSHVFSPRESLPPAQGGSFFVVQITDLTPAQIVQWFRSRAIPELCDEEKAAVTVEPESVARRVFHIRIADVPPSVRQQINTTGRYVTTWDAIRTFIQNRTTQANL